MNIALNKLTVLYSRAAWDYETEKYPMFVCRKLLTDHRLTCQKMNFNLCKMLLLMAREFHTHQRNVFVMGSIQDIVDPIL